MTGLKDCLTNFIIPGDKIYIYIYTHTYILVVTDNVGKKKDDDEC